MVGELAGIQQLLEVHDLRHFCALGLRPAGPFASSFCRPRQRDSDYFAPPTVYDLSAERERKHFWEIFGKILDNRKVFLLLHNGLTML